MHAEWLESGTEQEARGGEGEGEGGGETWREEGLGEFDEEVWPHLLRESDFHAARSAQKASEGEGREEKERVGEGEGERGGGGGEATIKLSWGEDGWWDLSEEQLRLLSFEALLLCEGRAEREETGQEGGREVDRKGREVAQGEVVAGARVGEQKRRGLEGMSDEENRRLVEELSRRL
ncbi:MAG: hypothetical protein SGPRY_008354, partial [Prymnesium sp.]